MSTHSTRTEEVESTSEELQRDATNHNTEREVPLPEGLTPQQEQAASLLASGMAIQDVADRLDIHRSTLWHWRQRETFQAHLNTLRREAAQDALGRLISLQADALDTVTRIMENGDDTTALKAARYVLEQASEVRIGATDPRAILRAAFTADDMSKMMGILNQSFDEYGYEARCKELGIEP
jgi:DNA-binding CsgD family transcriptional regulator